MNNKTILLVLSLALFISCAEKKNDEFFIDESCVLDKLNYLNINANLQLSENNNLIEIILKKPYNKVDEYQHKLLTNFLIPCLSNINSEKPIKFTIYLDKEKGISKNEFSYTTPEISAYLQKDEILKKQHEYILKEFDKKDMIVLNNFIAGFYKNYPFKEDIHDVHFLDLLDYLRDERNDSDKAKLTFLLLYGTSKESGAEDMQNVPKHLKSLWSMVIKTDIETVLSETFGN